MMRACASVLKAAFELTYYSHVVLPALPQIRPRSPHSTLLRRSILMALALAAASACAGTGPFTWYRDLPKSEWNARALGGPPEYVIGPGDAIGIHVYEQENLTGAAKVRSDGRVSVALIGEVVAAGKHPSALARELEGRLREFVVSPRVTVSVEASQPVAITTLGEVAHPGALTLDPPADLLQALALSGGPTEFADRSRIFVVRRYPEFRRIRFTYDAIMQNEGGAAQFPLRAGDAIAIE
jgi:polysaccharide biosynthesis/export protein